ncbi:MAG: sigma-70 family RNA polymerase sigma factor [Planctomycetes bacterium]|nr:sigma-70 family RNA polymerase sigma factor [Planctomycetota bacterium]
MGPDDNELIARILKGDRLAANVLVERYQKLVYSIAYRIVHNHADADDLVQSIFMRMFRGLGSYVPGTEFKSWLYAIATNTSLNVRKQAKRQKSIAVKAAALTQTADHTHPGADLMSEEARHRIERAIEKLPEEQRVVLHLRLREDLTHEQIAKIVGVPPATVTSRLFLARKKLVQLLRDV